MNFRMIFRSSLFHFFALGALIFAGFALLNETPPTARLDSISLSNEEARMLAERFSATWNRPPTTQELDGLMRNWALEEASVREALALGLDQGDAIIRQRLNLKMQYIAESAAAALTPDDATLQSYLDANSERFMQPARMAFEQVILPPDGDPSELRARLEKGADPSTIGKASLLPPTLPLTPAPVIDRTFGTGFHASLAELVADKWSGPVQSAYGQHLVRVIDAINGTISPLADIRDRVEAEWRASEMQQMRATFNAALLEQYSVSLPDPDAVLGQ
ncbi:peptidyl-prolyl cis-trans isomerase [Roseobacter sp.]|uniref:peptidylprolyl isomerase n=1 Tax=Roseobacter sp. TaxID=1907202 RepID=UPI00385B9180